MTKISLTKKKAETLFKMNDSTIYGYIFKTHKIIVVVVRTTEDGTTRLLGKVTFLCW